MRFKKLTHQQAVKAYAEVYAAHGAETMLKSFGWSHPPEQFARMKKVYACYVGKDLVGIGSIYLDLADASDDEAFLTVTVLPEHQRKGYRRQILDGLAEKALEMGADQVSIIVYARNEAQYARTIQESKTGSPWVHAGDVWRPVPYAYFIYEKQPCPSA